MNNITKVLQERVDGFAALGHVPLLELFVLRNGKIMKPRRRIGSKKPDKNCFENSLKLVTADVSYVEGFAMSAGLGIPMHHAWVDVGGKAMDPTWKNYNNSEYIGVSFSDKAAWSETIKLGYYGLLSGDFINAELLFRMDPELEDIMNRGKEARYEQT